MLVFHSHNPELEWDGRTIWAWERVSAMENVTDLFFPSELLSDWAHYYVSLPLFPLFSTVTFILTAYGLRSEPGSVQFTFAHPIASCVMTFILGSLGGILANTMVGRPPLECVANGWNVASGVLCWYLIFFSPFDLAYYLCAATPVQLLLCVIDELGRAKKVLGGVTLAAAFYPNSLIAMAIVGMFKGSGKKWGMSWYRAICQPQSANKYELLGISYVTKASFTLGLVIAYNHSQATPLLEEAHLVVIIAVLLAIFKIWNVLSLGSHDPFSLPQQLSWSVLTAMSFTPPPRQPLVSKATSMETKREKLPAAGGRQTSPDTDSGAKRRTLSATGGQISSTAEEELDKRREVETAEHLKAE